MTTIDSQERFLEAQFQRWRRRGADKKPKRAKPVIAIARQPGCDGEGVAKMLAEAFGLELYDWRLVELIAKDAHVSERVVATLEDKPSSELDDWLAGFVEGHNLSSHKHLQSLRRVLFAIAAHGNAVILGRGRQLPSSSGKKNPRSLPYRSL